jgi:serine/threonine protein kinase
MSEQSIFIEALERDEPRQRASFLNEACAGNAELRRRVERLLHRHDDAGSFLEAPAAGLAASTDSSIAECVGSVIGPYKLLQQIGEGGMGVVFMAEQMAPVQRTVALKIIKPGMDTRQVIARFEAERQALAMMDHPNIARVLDAGTTGGEPDGVSLGRPYFVMDLVRGIPITDYCDQQQLTIHKRLELIAQVCHAVQHAHQKGIIHRDLKPSNVLVAEYDGEPVPKVIDFGVAKATAQRLTEHTLFTEYGQLIGTFQYMSPEQARFNQLDVDTRSDIYSLGALLYELLTGSTPLEKERLRSTPFDEILKIIGEEEPPLLRTRLSSSQALDAISERRRIEPAKLTKLVDGELNWIVMKCLEKDRNRRYETASALANDLEHYLRDQPVEACPPSRSYRLKKLIRRNKAAVFAAVTIVAALTAGLTLSSIGFIQARHQAEIAGRAEAQALHDRDDKEMSRRNSEEVSKFLISAFRSPDPLRDGHAVKIVEVLDRDVQELKDKFNDAPLTKAALLDAIGQSYDGLGLPTNAIPLLEEALAIRTERLGPEHDDTLAAMNNLAQSYRHADRFDDAIELLGRALAIIKRKHGADDVRTLEATVYLADLYPKVGRISEAVPMIEDAVGRLRLRLKEDDPALLWPMHDLADMYKEGSIHRYDDALAIYEQLLKVRTEKLGPDYPDTLLTMHNIANVLVRSGRPDEAIPLMQETIRLRQGKLGPDHPNTIESMRGLATAFRAAGRVREATALELEMFRLLSAKLGSDNPDAVEELLKWAKYCNAHKRYADEIAVYEELLKFKPQSAEYCAYLAQILTNPHAPELADPKRALDLATKAVTLDPDSDATWTALGWVRYRWGDWKGSIEAMTRSDDLAKHPDVPQRFNLSVAHWRLGQAELARQWYDKAVQAMNQSDPKNARFIAARQEAAAQLGIDLPKSETVADPVTEQPPIQASPTGQ